MDGRRDGARGEVSQEICGGLYNPMITRILGINSCLHAKRSIQITDVGLLFFRSPDLVSWPGAAAEANRPKHGNNMEHNCGKMLHT